MTFSSESRGHSAAYDHGRVSAKALPQRRLGGAALAVMVAACGWTLWANLGGNLDVNFAANLVGSGVDQAAAARPPAAKAYAKLSAALNAYAASAAHAKLATALQDYARRSEAAISTVALFDSRYLGFPPGTFAKGAPPQADGEPAAAAAVLSKAETTQAVAAAPSSSEARRRATPPPRLALPPTRMAALGDDSEASRATSDTGAEQPSIFEKLFGKAAPLTLAYAAPDDGGLAEGHNLNAGRYDRETAVYDISAHTVYMPDGSKLEAHSGLGSRLDDPSHADERMRGATPPNVYDLQLREAPFHGVQALRLIPVDEHKVFGRSGLLAHTFMLGPNGQSNGCVSFRNYSAFLQAYLRHEIKRLVVVARLDS